MAGVKRILRLLWEIIWLWEVRIGNFILGDNELQEVCFSGII